MCGEDMFDGVGSRDNCLAIAIVGAFIVMVLSGVAIHDQQQQHDLAMETWSYRPCEFKMLVYLVDPVEQFQRNISKFTICHYYPGMPNVLIEGGPPEVNSLYWIPLAFSLAVMLISSILCCRS